MANPLTGDFPALLQVRWTALYRVLTAMHRNSDPERGPTLPRHVSGMRIGHDGTVVEGVKGTVDLQLGMPWLEPVDRSTNTVRLQVAIRAHFTPDPGDPDTGEGASEPLADFVGGILHARYRMQPESTLQFAVAPGSTMFVGEGSSYNLMAAFLIDQDRLRRIVTAYADHILRRRFRPRAIQAGGRFRPDSLLGLNPAQDPPAVAIPLNLGPGVPSGDLNSIQRVFRRDVALGISKEHLMREVEPALETLRKLEDDYPVGVAGIAIHYAIDTVSTPEWTSHGNAASVALRITGHAGSDVPFTGVDIKASIVVYLRWSSGGFSAEAYEPWVGLDCEVTARPFKERIRAAIKATISAKVAQALAPAVDLLNRSGEVAGELTTQLGRLARGARATFTRADFEADGILLSGVISGFDENARGGARFETEEEYIDLGAGLPPDPLGTRVPIFIPRGVRFNAQRSWADGGEIQQLDWSWGWDDGTDEGGTVTFKDRFELRRPRRMPLGGVAAIEVERPLPGLDPGKGWVTLTARGVRFDPAGRRFVGWYDEETRRWGYPPINLTLPPDKIPVRHGPTGLGGGVTLLGGRPGVVSANTLVVIPGDQEAWGSDSETRAALTGGLAATDLAQRGLLTVVLMPEGAPDLPDVEHLVRELPAAAMVAENIGSAWDQPLAVTAQRDPGQPSWRLMSPRGGVSWIHEGPLSDSELAAALDGHLLPAPPPSSQAISEGPAAGTHLVAAAAGRGLGAEETARLHAALGGRPDASTLVVFAHPDEPSSAEQVEALLERQSQPGADAPHVAVVLNGAREAAPDLSAGVDVIPDPVGELADSLDVEFWPTTVLLDPNGVVVRSWSGRTLRPLDLATMGQPR